jgi:hypothetical protein
MSQAFLAAFWRHFWRHFCVILAGANAALTEVADFVE